MALGKNLNDKSDPAACIYQVIILKTSKQKLSEIYFLASRFALMEVHTCFLIISQSLKAIVNPIKILKMLTARKIEKLKPKAIKYTPGQHCFMKHLNY